MRVAPPHARSSVRRRGPIRARSHHHRHRRKRSRRPLRPRLPAISAAARRPLRDRFHRTLPVPFAPRRPVPTSRRKRRLLRARSTQRPNRARLRPSKSPSRTSRKSARSSTSTNLLPPSIPRKSPRRKPSAASTSSTSSIPPPTTIATPSISFPESCRTRPASPTLPELRPTRPSPCSTASTSPNPPTDNSSSASALTPFAPSRSSPRASPPKTAKAQAAFFSLNTGIGDDHFRFFATDFIPSIQNKHGWRFDQFLPRFTFSGPIEKGRVWFYNAFDGEYDNTIYTELPVGADNDHPLRIGNLTKFQANLTSRNILTTSFLVNHLHDQYAFLSPQSPQLSNPKDVESAYVASVKDQHYFAGGQLLETGFAFDQYNLQLTPYGSLPYYVNPNTAGGSFYLRRRNPCPPLASPLQSLSPAAPVARPS